MPAAVVDDVGPGAGDDPSMQTWSHTHDDTLPEVPPPPEG